MMHHCAAGGGGGTTTRGNNGKEMLDAKNISRPNIFEYVDFEGKLLKTRYFDVEVFDNSALRKQLFEEEKNNDDEQDDWPVMATNLKDDSSEAEPEDESEDEEEDWVEPSSKFNSPHHVKYYPGTGEFYLVAQEDIYLKPPPPNRYYYEGPQNQHSEEQEVTNETAREDTAAKTNPREVNKKSKHSSVESSRPMQQRRIEARSTDVLGGSGEGTRENPGNVLFRNLVKMHLAKYKRTGKDIVALIINQIHKQEPPGRFLSPDNKIVLTGIAERNKVTICLRFVFARSPYKQSQKGSKLIAVETRKTDVLGGKGKSQNPGNVLFRQLVRMQQYDDFKRDKKAAVKLIVQKVHKQKGRFLSSDNRRVLTGRAEEKKVSDCILAVFCYEKSKAT